jgi:hypothetical protein
VPRFNSGSALTESSIFNSGSFVGIGKTNPTTTLDITGSLFVTGSIRATDSVTASYMMLKSPNTSSNSTIVFSGSLTSSIRLEVLQDGGISFIGSSGTLFGISDSLSGSLMSVNDVSGMPIFEVFSDERVVMGGYNQNVLVVTGSDIGIGKANPNLAFILDVSGSVAITGSLNVSSGITGSLLGTASYANMALTASYALNAAGGGGGSGLISSSQQLTNGQGFAFDSSSNVTFGQVTSSYIMLRSPNTSSNAAIVFSGSLTSSISLEVLQNGALSFMGSNGALFDISDVATGSLLSVNDISGLPIFEVYSDDRVILGAYGNNTMVVTGSSVGIKKIPTLGFALDVSGDMALSGSLFMLPTALMRGTSSWASSAITASYALSGWPISSSVQLTNNQGFAFTTASNVTFGTVTSSYMMLRSPSSTANATMVFSGSSTSSIRLEVLQDGSVSFIGSAGTLFGITDSLSGSLMNVSDITGLPIFEVFSDDRIVMGKFGSNALVVSGSSFVGTGSILGTASYAESFPAENSNNILANQVFS